MSSSDAPSCSGPCAWAAGLPQRVKQGMATHPAWCLLPTRGMTRLSITTVSLAVPSARCIIPERDSCRVPLPQCVTITPATACNPTGTTVETTFLCILQYQPPLLLVTFESTAWASTIILGSRAIWTITRTSPVHAYGQSSVSADRQGHSRKLYHTLGGFSLMRVMGGTRHLLSCL